MAGKSPIPEGGWVMCFPFIPARSKLTEKEINKHHGKHWIWMLTVSKVQVGWWLHRLILAITLPYTLKDDISQSIIVISIHQAKSWFPWECPVIFWHFSCEAAVARSIQEAIAGRSQVCDREPASRWRSEWKSLQFDLVVQGASRSAGPWWLMRWSKDGAFHNHGRTKKMMVYFSWNIPSRNGWFGGSPISGNHHMYAYPINVIFIIGNKWDYVEDIVGFSWNFIGFVWEYGVIKSGWILMTSMCRHWNDNRLEGSISSGMIPTKFRLVNYRNSAGCIEQIEFLLRNSMDQYGNNPHTHHGWQLHKNSTSLAIEGVFASIPITQWISGLQ